MASATTTPRTKGAAGGGEPVPLQTDEEDRPFSTPERFAHFLVLELCFKLSAIGLTANEAIEIIKGNFLKDDPTDLDTFKAKMQKLALDDLEEVAECWTTELNKYPKFELAESRLAIVNEQIALARAGK
jgi:hypothetical protein